MISLGADQKAASVALSPDRNCDGRPTWWWFAQPGRCSESDPEFDDEEQSLKVAAERQAMTLCVGCPLALACAQASWDVDEFGIFGGIRSSERWALGGRGRGRGNATKRTRSRWVAAREAVAGRFGDEHEVTQWVLSLPVPRGCEAPVDVAHPDAA